jgi:hypothetical protein
MNMLMDIAAARSILSGNQFQDLWQHVRMARTHVANTSAAFC